MFKRACSDIRNKLYINGAEVDLTNKRAILTRNSVAAWQTKDITYLTNTPGKIFKYGNNLCSAYNDHISKFNTETDSWDIYISGNELDRYNKYSGILVIGDEIHLFGGLDKAYQKQHYKYSYDSDNQTWVLSPVSTLPYAFYNGAVEYVNGEIHLMGGGPSATTKKSHYIYKDGKWSKSAALSSELYGRNFSFVYNGELHLVLNYVYNSKKKIYKQNHIKFENGTWVGGGSIKLNSSYFNDISSSVIYGIGASEDGAFLLLAFSNYYLSGGSQTPINPPLNKVYLGSISDMVMTEFSDMPIMSDTSTVEEVFGYLVDIIYFGSKWYIFNDEYNQNLSYSAISYSLSIEDI